MWLASNMRFVSVSGFVWAIFVLALATANARGEENAPKAEAIAVFPNRVELRNREMRQRILVQRIKDGLIGEQIREGAQWKVEHPEIAKIENGVLIPLKDGETTASVAVDGKTELVAIVVSGQGEPFTWSFRNHVESVLSKAGCNSGACHGARAGQKGFRLTLFGYDLDADYTYLTRQATGRRISPTDPGRSLLLTKPTGMTPHKGGIRFEPDSLEYRVLAEWIASGTPGPSDNDSVITKLEVLPNRSIQKPGLKQQLVVLAHFSDGRIEDATAWAKYTSDNLSVATVGDRGEVQIPNSGEAAIKVWYQNLNALAFVSAPFERDVPAELYQVAEGGSFIDELVNAKLKSLHLAPSPRCDDATFIRRAHLDTIGVLPTAEEVKAYLADSRVDKRRRLVDSLLSRTEFIDYWTYKWSDLLLVNGSQLRPPAVKAYYAWIRENVAANTPWDKMIVDLVTAKGSTISNGAANFYALHKDPETTAETIAQAFMGLSINCAKCHNHPLEKWTNDQYYGMANLFARVRTKNTGGVVKDGDVFVFSDVRGELIQPSKGKPQPPRPLDGEALDFASTDDRRETLAKWLTSRENPYFAKSIANRVWANFFGVGIVERVDDLRVTNPPSNAELLDGAAKYLVEHQFDLKELMRTILNSESYQRSSTPALGNEVDDRFYSRYYPRRLKAELLLDAVSQATAAPTEFKDQAKGLRALQLNDSAVASYFLQAFGRPDRIITCECERSDDPSMTQVLHLYNGDTLNLKLQAAGNRIDAFIKANADDATIIDDLYFEALSRPPTDAEKASLLATMKVEKPEDRRAAIEDLYWGVLTSREFLFQH
jgi:hypothetical protein